MSSNNPDLGSDVVTESEIVNTGFNVGSESELNANESDLYSGVLKHTRNAMPETRNVFPIGNSGRNTDHFINGCARTTPILNQRFGVNFTRRYTMPHGAPYPLRPSPDSQGYRNVLTKSPLYQTRQPNSYLEMSPSQNNFYSSGQSRINSQKQLKTPHLQSSRLPHQKQKFMQQSTYHNPLQTLGAQTSDIQGFASENGRANVRRSRNNAVTPILESTCDSHNPIIWREVHHRREESISTQKAAKSIELAEFQKLFCNDTPVREVLASGWFKKQTSGKVDASDTHTSLKNKTVQDIVDQPLKKSTKNVIEQQKLSQNINANRNTIVSESSGQTDQIKTSQANIPKRRSKSILTTMKRIPVNTFADDKAANPECSALCSPDDVYNESVNDIKTAAERAERSVNCVLPNFNPKEQFPKEIVEQAQQMQVQAQQVVQNRKGMNTSCLEDPRYFSQIRSQRKSFDNYKTNLQQVGTASLFSRDMKFDSPNILKKNRNSDAVNFKKSHRDASEFNQNQMIIPNVSNLPLLPSNDVLDHTRKRIEETETPRKRQRKQLLVSDVCAPAPASNSSLFHEAKQEVIDYNSKTVSSTTPTDEKLKIQVDNKEKEDAPTKKIRGRPRKTPKIEESSTPTLKNEKKLLTITDLKEEERMTQIQTSSYNLVNSVGKNLIEKINVGSEMEYDDEQQQGQLSLTHSLQFLQSLTTTDPHTLLFGGNNVRTLIDMDGESSDANSNSQSENKTKCNFSLILQEDKAFLPPPTATAVATSVQPLILDFQSPPKLIEAPIWTDDSGALVPLSMYQKDIKKEKKLMDCILRAQDHETETQPYKIPYSICDSKHVDKSDTFHNVHIDKQLIDEPKWKPADNAVRKGMKKLNRGILIPTGKITSQQIQYDHFEKKSTVMKRKDSNWSRFLAIKQPQLPRANYRRYKRLFFQREISTDAYVKQSMCRKLNEYWNTLVTTCCFVEFDQTSTHICAKIDDISVQFDINWDSCDSKNRWLDWQQKIISDVAVPTKKKILLQHAKHLEHFIQVIRGKSGQNLTANIALKKLAFQMETLRTRFTNTLQNLASTVSFSNFFRIKYESLKVRLKKTIERRDVYCEALESIIFGWKLATNNYNGASSETDKKYRRNDMNKKWTELRRSLQFYDALVDVIMFASRLLPLYYDVSNFSSSPMAPVKKNELLQSIEDTECFLLLSEAKVKLLELAETSRTNDRIHIINVYIAADKMNIAKGKFERTVNLEKMEYYKQNLSSTIHHFSSQCRRVDLSAIVDMLPNIQKYHHEENKSIGQGTLLRTNIFKSSGNFELELAVKLLASSILRKTALSILVLSPQTTTIIDEMLESEGRKKKNEPRLSLNNLLPMMRWQNTEYVKRCKFSEMQVLKRDTIHLRSVQVSDNLKNNSMKILRFIQEKTAKFENCLDNGEDDYNPGMHDISQSSKDMQLICNAFVDRKIKEATYRRNQLLKNNIEKMNGINGNKKPNNETGNIIENIRRTSALLLETSDPGKFGQCKKLLKEQKKHFHSIHNQKRKRRFCSLEFELSEKNVVPKIDWNFEHVVDALESMCATNSAE